MALLLRRRATAGADQTVAVPAAALTLAGFAPSILSGGANVIAVPSAGLALAGLAPTVSLTDHKTIAVPGATLLLTAFAPSVLTVNGQTILVPLAALTLAAFAPIVTSAALATAPAGLGFPPRRYVSERPGQAASERSASAGGLRTGQDNTRRRSSS